MCTFEPIDFWKWLWGRLRFEKDFLAISASIVSVSREYLTRRKYTYVMYLLYNKPVLPTIIFVFNYHSLRNATNGKWDCQMEKSWICLHIRFVTHNLVAGTMYVWLIHHSNLDITRLCWRKIDNWRNIQLISFLKKLS